VLIDLPRSADVVIVGGGFAGLATAAALRARKITDVVVLEREKTLGEFASGRSAGLGRQLAEDDPITALTVRGAAILRQRYSTCWTATGGVLSFDNVDHAEAYRERAGRFGVQVDSISREMVVAHWPQLGAMEIAAAIAIPSDGVIAIQALLAAYAKDATLALGAPVEQIVEMQGGARVVTKRGDIVTRCVVDASGAWAGQLVGEPPLESLKRHVYVMDAKATKDAPYAWHLGACELYTRELGGQALVSPCDATPVPAGHQEPDDEGEAKLRRAFAGSSLENAPIARVWACQRTFTASGAMKLGRDAQRPWLVWAVGLGGHGATASAAVGETVAAAVAAV